jgi:hypothetical protein
LRPYPGERTGNNPDDERRFNYRLSRARRLSESCFGIFVARWRLFYNGRIQLTPANVNKVLKATVVLHNYLTVPGVLPRVPNCRSLPPTEAQRNELKCLPKLKGMHASDAATNVRDDFKDFVNSRYGAVEWQDRRCDIEE